MKITAQQIYEASCAATPTLRKKPWSEVSDAARAKYTVIADYLNAQTVQELEALIKRHIANLEREIEEQQARIRKTYGGGVHTNVDPQRAAILTYELRKRALEMVLDEIS